MKISVLVLSALAILSLQVISAYAQYLGDIEKLVIWPPECIGINCPPVFESSLNALVEPISKSDIVLVGKIIEAKQILKQNQTEYGIKIDKYIKTRKSFDLITAIGDGVYKKGYSHLTEIEYYNSPIFKKDDAVFVYLNYENGTYKISPYSFAISKNIPTGPPPEIMFASSDKLKYRYGDTITISGSVKKAYIFDSSIRNQDSSVYLLVKNPDNVVYENRTLDVLPDGTFSYQFKIKGKFAIDGQYSIDVYSGGMTWSWPVSYESGHVRPPLQQYKAETREPIKCKASLELLLKAFNGHPACVTPETKTDLLKRGWGSDTWPFKSVQKIDTTSSTICTQNGGHWLDQYKECEYVSAEKCSLLGGQYEEKSNCRHNPSSEWCAGEGMPVCTIGNTISNNTEYSNTQREITVLSISPQNVTLPEPKKQTSKTTCNAHGACFTPE